MRRIFHAVQIMISLWAPVGSVLSEPNPAQFRQNYPKKVAGYSVIGKKPVSELHPFQDEVLPLVANDCIEARKMEFPFRIKSSNLPYQQSFDTTQAADNGDYRGSAADDISRPGGHDGFWIFTPEKTGSYLLSLGATKQSASPIPGHDFELTRGFGGIGVWKGDCVALKEIGTAGSVVGDSVLSVFLDSEAEYVVIWEDYYVGSTENSVTLSIQWLGQPEGNEITSAINLNDLKWGFEVPGDTTPNRDLVTSECIQVETGEGHGSGSDSVSGTDIWYRLPAVTAGIDYKIFIAPGDGSFPVVDTVLSLHAYNLTTHQVALVQCVDDSDTGELLSSISFQAAAGLIYYVMVETKPAYDQTPFGQFLLRGEIVSEPSFVRNWQSYKE